MSAGQCAFFALARFAACAQAVCAQLDGAACAAGIERLRIGVGANELNALHARGNHVLHRIAATAAHTNHLDFGALVKVVVFDHFNAHLGAPGVGFSGVRDGGGDHAKPPTEAKEQVRCLLSFLRFEKYSTSGVA
jgi:hypothetical protein